MVSIEMTESTTVPNQSQSNNQSDNQSDNHSPTVTTIQGNPLHNPPTDIPNYLSMFTGKSSFEYLLYNGLCQNNVGDAIDTIVQIQEKLFDFGISLSGFQFVGIVFESSTLQTAPDYMKVSYFFLAIGFVVSLFGALLSYIVSKFLLSAKQESTDFILYSMYRYKRLFNMSYIIPYLNAILFLVPINMILYNSLDFAYCLIFNIISGLLFLFGIFSHHVVIVANQQYQLLDTNYTITRKYNRRELPENQLEHFELSTNNLEPESELHED